jgi:hypothetical protein
MAVVGAPVRVDVETAVAEPVVGTRVIGADVGVGVWADVDHSVGAAVV